MALGLKLISRVPDVRSLESPLLEEPWTVETKDCRPKNPPSALSSSDRRNHSRPIVFLYPFVGVSRKGRSLPRNICYRAAHEIAPVAFMETLGHLRVFVPTSGGAGRVFFDERGLFVTWRDVAPEMDRAVAMNPSGKLPGRRRQRYIGGVGRGGGGKDTVRTKRRGTR